MRKTSIPVNLFNTVVLLVVICLGIFLFFLREQKIPHPISHEIKIRPQASTQRIVSNEYLVLIHPSRLDKLPELLESLSLEQKMPILNWILVAKKGAKDNELVSLSSEEAEGDQLIVGSLLQNQFVLDAQLNYVLDGTVVPNNRSFDREWQFKEPSKIFSAMNLPSAWEVTQGSKDVVVAVVDQFAVNGEFTFRERFKACQHRVTWQQPFPHLMTSYNADTTPHGEILLQSLGGCANVPAFSTGMDWNAQILAVERPSVGHAQSFLAALAVSGIDVCSESVTACPSGVRFEMPKKLPDVLLLPFGGDAPELLQFSADMISAILKKNIIVVSSAGNNQVHANNFFPGGIGGVINVGALNQKGALANFSNWGSPVDLLAPGDDIEIAYPNGPKMVSGTSLASAYVAGAISLMKAVNKDLDSKEALLILKQTGRKLPCDQYCQFSNDKKAMCQTECCSKDPSPCGMLALDVAKALDLAKNFKEKPALLDLSEHYVLYLRNEPAPKTITVKNRGLHAIQVKAETSDNNIVISPSEFVLTGASAGGNEQTIELSFHKDPFTRQTYRIELRALLGAELVDREEFYLEYIPKN